MVGTSKSNDDDTLEVIGQLQNMSTVDNIVTICANCGKEGAKNICNKCNVARYCNAVCKKIHKKKHKKDCEEHVRHAAEKHNEDLRRAAELHDIELFKQPPPKEDCPICFQQLPLLNTGYRYQTCCGKVICSGCDYAPVFDNQGNKVDNEKCPFCRTPHSKSAEEEVERQKKRVEARDPLAIHKLGIFYSEGTYGYPKDYSKALELYHQAAKLGYAAAYTNIGYAYHFGEGAEVDKKMAVYYYELAAMKGSTPARYNLGTLEDDEDNFDRALKHYMIAIRGGESKSLGIIKEMYLQGDATKDDYTIALRSYQSYLSEIKSDQRDEAAAADDRFRYY